MAKVKIELSDVQFRLLMSAHLTIQDLEVNLQRERKRLREISTLILDSHGLPSDLDFVVDPDTQILNIEVPDEAFRSRPPEAEKQDDE